jgi:hypothetical protein
MTEDARYGENEPGVADAAEGRQCAVALWQ